MHQSGLICRGVLAFLFWLAVVHYPTSVGFVRVALCILSHPYCISVQSSIYPLRPCYRLIFLVVSSLGGSLLSAAKATSSLHWLAPAGIHSRWICPSHNNSLLISCPLFISICTSHNVTITQSCFLLSHIPVATRGHSGIKNLPLPHLLWQHEATLISLLATRGHSLISVESRAHTSPVATRGHFCYLLWNHGPTTVIWQHEAISFTCLHRACMKQNRRVDGVHWGGLGKSRTRKMDKK